MQQSALSTHTTVPQSFKHISRLFLPQYVEDWCRRSGVGADQRRRRLPRHLVFLGFIHYALSGFRNLTHSLGRATEEFDLPRQISSGSTTPARKRLPSKLLAFARSEIERMTPQLAPALSDFRVICIDGTAFNVADSPANESAFGRNPGCRGKTAFPAMRAVLAMDAACHMFIAEAHGPYAVQEGTLADQLIDQVAAPGVLIELDRGLCHRERMLAIRECGAHVLGRVRSNIRLPVLQRFDDGSYRSVMRPHHTSQDKRELAVRVVEYRVHLNGKVSEYRIVTTVMDPERLSAQQMAHGYHLRWQEEVGIRELKWLLDRFQEPSFPGRSPGHVKQEYQAMLLAHAALRCLLTHAALEHGRDPARMSLSGALQTLAAFLRHPPRRGGMKSWLEALLREMARQVLPNRSPRSYPRCVKRKMSNYASQARASPPIHGQASLELVRAP